MANSKRLIELEGLRGLAAVAVVIYHFLVLLYPALRSGDTSLAHTSFEDNIYGTPLTLFFAGTFAVAIFFVLSGFVLSVGYFKTKDDSFVKRLAAGRYLRLMLPALASTMLAYLFIEMGAHALTSSAGEISGSVQFSNKWSTDLSFFEALRTGLVDVYVNPDAILLNGVLWTMYFELIGSFLVFGFLLLFAKSNYRWVGYLLLSIATFGTWFLSFVIGMAIADAYTHGLLDKIKGKFYIAMLSVGVIILGTFPKKASGTFYEFLQFDFFSTNYRLLYLTIASALVLLLVLASKGLAQWLKKPRVSTLGKYTYSLYLSHLFVIYIVSSFIIINLHDVIGYNRAVLVAAIVSTPLFVIISYLYEKYIDAPSINLAKSVGEVYLGKRKIEWRERYRQIVDRLSPFK